MSKAVEKKRYRVMLRELYPSYDYINVDARNKSEAENLAEKYLTKEFLQDRYAIEDISEVCEEKGV